MARRLLFYTTSLSGGGAERVWTVLASELARRGHDVTLALDFDAEANRPYLAPEVKVDVIGEGEGLRRHVRSLVALATLLRRLRPDFMLTAVGGSDVKGLAAAATLGRTSRVITSYHGYLENETGRFGAIHVRLARLWTRLAAATVCVSEGLRRDMIDRWHASPRACVRIYNPIVVAGADAPLAAAGLAAREALVAAAGRVGPG